MSNQTKDGANSTEALSMDKKALHYARARTTRPENKNYDFFPSDELYASGLMSGYKDGYEEAKAEYEKALQAIRAHIEHTETDYTDGKIFVPKTDLLKYIDSYLTLPHS